MPNIPLQQSRRWRCRPVLALPVVLLACWLLPLAAHAQVHRCTMPTGSVIYTDRACADLGAVEPRRDPETTVPTRLYRGGCARNLRDLVYEMTTAIDAGDVNRLAALYHWPGISSRAATSIMQRLEAIVQRPLVDIAVVAVGAGPDATAAAADTIYQPLPPPDAEPSGVRIEQTAGDSATPARTMFGLRRNVGCWWVRF